METIPLICSANQCTGFYMITASVMKELSTYETALKNECELQMFHFDS